MDDEDAEVVLRVAGTGAGRADDRAFLVAEGVVDEEARLVRDGDWGGAVALTLPTANDASPWCALMEARLEVVAAASLWSASLETALRAGIRVDVAVEDDLVGACLPTRFRGETRETSCCGAGCTEEDATAKEREDGSARD